MSFRDTSIDNKRLALTLVVIGAFSGCSKKDAEQSKDHAAVASTKEKAAPTKQPLTAAWFGKAVAPPGLLANVKLGGSYAEALEAVGANSSGDLPETELEGVRYGISKNDGIVTELNLWLPQAQKPLLVQAWGAGTEITSPGGSKDTVWFNPESGIRARYSVQSSGEDAYLRFESYLPLAKLLGEGTQIAALAQPLIGLTPEEAAKGYPEYADEQDFSLTLPPTEWEFGETNVISYVTTGTIESVSFKIAFAGPAEKDAILAAIKAKWGEPKGENKLSSTKAKIYNEADPHIEVDEKCSGCRNEIEIQLSK